MFRVHSREVLIPIFASAAALSEFAPLLSGGSFAPGAFVSVVIGLALIYVCIALSGVSFRIEIRSLAWIAFLLFMLALFSSLFWGSFYDFWQWWGLGSEIGSMETITLLCVCLALASVAPRKAAIAFLYTIAVGGALFAVIVLAAARWGSFPLFFQQPDSQISFMLCASALTGCVLADRGSKIFLRLLFGAAAAISLIGFGFAFSVPAAWVGILVSILAVALSFWIDGSVSARSLPLATFCFAAALAFLLGFGVRAPVAPLAVDVQPSSLAMQLVAGPVLFNSFSRSLIGTGANTFTDDWDQYAPPAINATPFWNMPPQTGDSTASTFAIEFGLLGLLLFFSIPVALMCVSAMNDPVSNNGIFEALAVVSLFIFGAALVYPVGPPLLLIAFAAAGFASALAARDIQVAFVPGRTGRAAIRAASLAAGAGLAAAGIVQTYASFEHAAGLSSADPAQAAVYLQNAAYVWAFPTYQIDASAGIMQSALATAQAQMNAGQTPNPDEFSRTVDVARGFADSAMGGTREDFETSLFRAQLYFSLAPYQVPGALDAASSSINAAELKAPARPDVLYLKAQIDAANGNASAAQADLEKALELKPDYQDAQNALNSLGG